MMMMMTIPPLRPGMSHRFTNSTPMSLRTCVENWCRRKMTSPAPSATGRPGQRQFGVDLLIDYKDGSLGAGQCKSHQSCDGALIHTGKPPALPGRLWCFRH